MLPVRRPKRKTGRYFRCIGLKENIKQNNWSKHVFLNRVYPEFEGVDEPNVLQIKITVTAPPYFRLVDADQFQEVEVRECRTPKELIEALKQGVIAEVSNDKAKKAEEALKGRINFIISTEQNKYNKGFTSFEIVPKDKLKG